MNPASASIRFKLRSPPWARRVTCPSERCWASQRIALDALTPNQTVPPEDKCKSLYDRRLAAIIRPYQYSVVGKFDLCCPDSSEILNAQPDDIHNNSLEFTFLLFLILV